MIANRKAWLRGLIPLGSLIVIAGLAWLLYGYILQLPLCWDDLWRLRLAERTWEEILRGWRPAQFVLFKALFLLQGRIDPVGIKALGLSMHTVNGMLCYVWIAGLPLARRRLVALAGAILFIAYPFSAEAVAGVALSHLETTALILGALILYNRSIYVFKRTFWLRLVSLLCAFIASMAHPSGVVAAPLLTVQLIFLQRSSIKRRWIGLVPYWGAAIAGTAIQKLAQTGNWRIEILAEGWRALAPKAAYLLQALAVPFAPFITGLYRLGLPINATLFAFCTFAFLLALFLYLLARLRLLPYGLMAIAIFIIAATPSFVMRDSIYVLRSPRLLYEASIGSALLWALPMAAEWRSRRQRNLGMAAAVIFFLYTAYSGIPYLDSIRSINYEIKAIVSNLLETVRNAGSRVLVVDFPGWLESNPSVFLMGRYEGKILSRALREDISELLCLNGLPGIQLQSVASSPKTDRWRYLLGKMSPTVKISKMQMLLRQQDSIFIANVQEVVALHQAGSLEAQAIAGSHFAAHYEQFIALLEMDVIQGAPDWRIDLHWQCWQPPEQDVKVLVHIYSSDNTLVASQESYPLGGLSRPREWSAGDLWYDIHYLHIPSDLPAGSYHITVGLSNAETLTPLQAFDSQNQRLPEDALAVGTLIIP